MRHLEARATAPHRPVVRPALGLSLALALAACSSDATQLLVVVDSDMSVPDQMSSFRAVVRSATTFAERSSYLFESAALRFPLSFAVGPGDDPRPPVIIDLEVVDAEGYLVFVRRVSTGFIEGKSLVLPVFLAGECVGHACPEELSCAVGGCVDPRVEPDTLCEANAPGCGVTPGDRDGGVGDASQPNTDAAAVDADPVDGTVDDGGAVDAGPTGRDAAGTDGGAVFPPWWRGQVRALVRISTADVAMRGDSVSVTFDHAAWVRDHGARMDGSDLRVARFDGMSWTEHARVLDPDSSWNRNDTRLWFAPDVNLAAGVQDTQTYLYAGDTTGAPLSDATQVFVLADDFEAGNTARWNDVRELNGAVTLETTIVHRGSNALRTSVGVGAGWASLEFRPAGGLRSAITTAWIRVPSGFDIDDALPIFYCGPSCSFDVPFGQIGGASFVGGGRPPFITYYSTQGAQSRNAAGSPVSGDTWHRVELRTMANLTTGRAELWIDGTRAASLGGLDTRMILERINVGLFYKRDDVDQADMYFDDVFVRPWRDPEPMLDVGPVETR